jgi:hypothetical protein
MQVQTRSMTKTAALNETKAVASTKTAAPNETKPVVSKKVRPNGVRFITNEKAASLRNNSSYHGRLLPIYMVEDKLIYEPEIGIHNRQDADRLKRGTAVAPEGYYWKYCSAGKTYFNDEWYELRQRKP